MYKYLNASLLCSTTLLTGCLVSPRVIETYDADCQIIAKHMVLDKGEMATMGTCRNTTECIGNLVGMGVMSAASAVVSGSIVVGGNVVYWLEKQGRCQKRSG